jgi:MFS family permease
MVSGSDQIDKKARRKRALLTGITSNVLVLGIVSLLTDASSEMIYPIMPYFLTAIGATGLVIGLIEGASETTASLVKVVSGWYSDRYRRRKPFITSGYGASSLVKPLFYLATHPLQVLGLRVIERVGKGVRSAPRDALIADSTEPQYRGRAFGFHKSMDSTGAVIGPILILPVLIAASTVTVGTYRLIFLFSAIPALLAVLVILLFVRDKEAVSTGRVGQFFKEMRQLGRPFYLLLIVVMTFYIGEISYAFFILQGSKHGFDIVDVTILYIFFNAVFVLTAIPAGVLSDRLGRMPVIAFSFIIFALSCLVMTNAGDWVILALGFGLFGVYKGSSEGVLKAFVTDFAPPNLRGTALGTFHTSVGAVMLPGGIIAGLLWDRVAPWATFAYGIIMAITALILLLVIVEERRTTVMPAGMTQ